MLRNRHHRPSDLDLVDETHMRVLFVCASGGRGRLQLGGAERFIVEMLPRLASRFEVAAAVSDPRLAESLNAAGIQTFMARPNKRFDIHYLNALRSIVRQFDPTVISAHLLTSSMHIRLLAPTLSGRRLVVTLHNSMKQYVDEAPEDERLRARVNLVLERIARFLVTHDSVAVSDFEYEELSHTKGRGRLWRISNSLPAGWPPMGSPCRSLRAELKLPEEGPILLYLGRLEYEKGADRLLGVLAQLPPEWCLVVVGDGSIQLAGDRVVVRGHTGDPAAYYRVADVGIVPSRVESFGRVALEAASLGCPVVHTGVGGLHELLKDFEGVIAWEAGSDAPSLAQGVIRAHEFFLGHPDECGAAASQLTAMHSFERMAQEWGNFLELSESGDAEARGTASPASGEGTHG